MSQSGKMTSVTSVTMIAKRCQLTDIWQGASLTQALDQACDDARMMSPFSASATLAQSHANRLRRSRAGGRATREAKKTTVLTSTGGQTTSSSPSLTVDWNMVMDCCSPASETGVLDRDLKKRCHRTEYGATRWYRAIAVDT